MRTTDSDIELCIDDTESRSDRFPSQPGYERVSATDETSWFYHVFFLHLISLVHFVIEFLKFDGRCLKTLSFI